MKTLGLLTIGQAPRPDGLAHDVQQIAGLDRRVVERGALDGLSSSELEGMQPQGDDYRLVTLLADGTPVHIAKRHILERLQIQIDRLEAEDNCSITLLLCTGSFPGFRHRRPLILPQEALYGAVLGMAADGAVGVLVPLPAQTEQAQQKWHALCSGCTVVLEPADPYCAQAHDAIRFAATAARRQGATILFLDCFGYDLEMGATARTAFGGPVVVARSLAARFAAEVMG